MEIVLTVVWFVTDWPIRKNWQSNATTVKRQTNVTSKFKSYPSSYKLQLN